VNREKLEHLKNDLSQRQFAHHKSQKEVPYKYYKYPVLIRTFTLSLIHFTVNIC